MAETKARRAAIKKASAARHHEPRSGRRAFLCGHTDQAGKPDCGLRRFVAAHAPTPECPQHGKMQIQANRPYKDQPIPAA